MFYPKRGVTDRSFVSGCAFTLSSPIFTCRTYAFLPYLHSGSGRSHLMPQVCLLIYGRRCGPHAQIHIQRQVKFIREHYRTNRGCEDFNNSRLESDILRKKNKSILGMSCDLYVATQEGFRANVLFYDGLLDFVTIYRFCVYWKPDPSHFAKSWSAKLTSCKWAGVVV